MMDKRKELAEKWYDENKKTYERFSCEMSDIIKKILESRNIPFQSISHRLKDKESYLKKCEKYSNPTDEIMDVSGIRIIAYTNQDVKRICEIIKDEFDVDEKNSINKADKLKIDEVGYLSVHFIALMKNNRIELAEYANFKGIKCEIQVRTLLQHAWAEIEHDRNYKFAGVLPNEIKRRFHLIAGVLEMMDNEFDKLSTDIDEYTKKIRNDVSEGKLNMDIDSKSLEQYMLKKYAGKLSFDNGIKITEDVANEIIAFGYKTIKEIDDDINKIDEWGIDGYNDTPIGVLRNVMIITDCNRYFTKSYNNSWQVTYKNSIDYWKSKGVGDIENYLEKNNIEIGDEPFGLIIQ